MKLLSLVATGMNMLVIWLPGYAGIHGGFGFGECNEDGERVLDFSVANNFVIANTFFQKRECHLATYHCGPFYHRLAFTETKATMNTDFLSKLIQTNGINSIRLIETNRINQEKIWKI